jgi:exosortase D (VPLPA-CTERM-specific)
VAAALGIALVYLFHAGIANLWFRWGEQQELSHSYFIPIISAWMIWERRDAMRQSMGKPNPAAFAFFAFGIFMVFALKQLHVFMLEHIGLLVALAGVPLLFGGLSLLRICFVPIAYLLFMIPPPYWVITVTSWNFQLWSSELGVWMIRLFDVPVLLNGNVIELGNITLQVVEACSGLRYLFPFLSLGALAAYFYKGPLWQRFIVVASTVPITIVMNSFRIAITGVLSDRYGASHTEGFLHFFEGWVVFLLCIVMLLGVILLLARLGGKKNVLSTLGHPEVQPIAPSKPWDSQLFLKMTGAAAAFVGLGALFVHTLEAPLVVPERAPFSELPLEFQDWRVEERPLDVATERVLKADDYIVLNMVDPEGNTFNLYTAYLKQQRNGSSWHSPAQCLPGGGWQFQETTIERTPEGAPDYAYNRILMQKGESQFLVYYWYDQRGRQVANEFLMKLYLIRDVLTKRRSDGAMIRLMTPILPDQTVAEAEAQLQGFQRRVETTMNRYVPD